MNNTPLPSPPATPPTDREIKLVLEIRRLQLANNRLNTMVNNLKVIAFGSTGGTVGEGILGEERELYEELCP